VLVRRRDLDRHIKSRHPNGRWGDGPLQIKDIV
jgi:hypothetical protein